MPTNEEIRKYLLQLLNGGADNQLGFHPTRSRVRYDYIYVKAQEGGPGVWHRLEGEKEARTAAYLDPVTEKHLTGNLLEVTMVEVATEKYGVALKIDFILDIGAPVPTIIRSGATTFMEGLLRPLMCAKTIHNPVTITAARAEKSEKAIFGDIEDASGLLILDKGMERLITWDSGDKARRGEILATFLPAVNNIRVKLGLEPLLEPVDRQALNEATRDQSAPKKTVAEIEIVPIADLDDRAISVKCFEIIKALGYSDGDGSQAVAFLKSVVGSAKFSTMNRAEKEAVITALYRKVADAIMQ